MFPFLASSTIFEAGKAKMSKFTLSMMMDV